MQSNQYAVQMQVEGDIHTQVIQLSWLVSLFSIQEVHLHVILLDNSVKYKSGNQENNVHSFKAFFYYCWVCDLHLLTMSAVLRLLMTN